MHCRFHIIALILLFITSTTRTSAQNDSTRYELQFRAGMLGGIAYPHNQWAKRLLTSDKLILGYQASVGWKARGNDVSESDEMFGRPTIEAGMLVMDYQHVPLHNNTPESRFPDREPSTIGQMITPYAAVSRPLLSTRHLDLGFRFEQGIGICTRPYDLKSNPENEFIGGRFAILVGMGFYAEYRLNKEWSIAADVEMHHYSNGRLDMPNMGINSFEAGLTAVYRIGADTVRHDPYAWNKRSKALKKDFKKHFYVDANVSWLPRVLLAEWLYTWNYLPNDDPRYRTGKFSYHHSMAADASLMYRYSKKMASGVGFEYVYAPLGKDIQYWENLHGLNTPLYAPHGLSLTLQHEAFYKNIGVHISLGYYVKREPQQNNDQRSPVYETAGLRYYLPVDHRRLYIGYNIRARATTADCFQFALGYAIGK